MPQDGLLRHTDRAAEEPAPSSRPEGHEQAPVLKSETRQTNWRRANPLKYRAHLAVQRALGAGVLDKGPCEVCGAEAVDAHHDRYDEPLAVRWLCRSHHVKLHHYGEDMFPIGAAPAEGRSSGD